MSAPDTSENGDGALLIRLDERTKQMTTNIEEIKESLSARYVTQDEFKPVKTITFALVGLICSSVILALVGLVVRLSR